MALATLNHQSTTAVAAAANAGVRWNSPMPYLFGGLAIVLGLIAMALIILACSNDKHSDDKDKDAASKSSATVDDGPKFVVIMAGADKPTFLAKPMPMPMPEPRPEPEPVLVPIAAPVATTRSTITRVHYPTGIELV